MAAGANHQVPCGFLYVFAFVKHLVNFTGDRHFHPIGFGKPIGTGGGGIAFTKDDRINAKIPTPETLPEEGDKREAAVSVAKEEKSQ